MIPLLVDPLLKPLLMAPLLPLLGFLFLGSSSWVPLLLLLGFLFFLFLGSSSWIPLLPPLVFLFWVSTSQSTSTFSSGTYSSSLYNRETFSTKYILVANNKKNTYLFFDSELWDCLCISSPSFLLVLLLVPLLPHLKREKRTTEYDLKRRYGGNRTETLTVI